MTTQRVISDWMLEQYLLGETDDALRQEIDRRLPNEPGLAERLAALKTHNERFLADYPPRVMAAAIKERARRTHVAKRRFMIPVLAGAGATLALLLVVFIGLPMMTELPCDDLRTDENGVIYYKGLKPSLHVYQKLGQEAVRLQEGEALAPRCRVAGRVFGRWKEIRGAGKCGWPGNRNRALAGKWRRGGSFAGRRRNATAVLLRTGRRPPLRAFLPDSFRQALCQADGSGCPEALARVHRASGTERSYPSRRSGTRFLPREKNNRTDGGLDAPCRVDPRHTSLRLVRLVGARRDYHHRGFPAMP